MSDNPEKQQPPSNEQPKDDGSGSLSNSKESKSTKSTTSTSSFEDFSKYRRDASKESLGKGQVPDATAKEREEMIKKLLEEQEKETARRQAEAAAAAAENALKTQASSESIEVVHKRLQNLKKKKIQELKQSEQKEQQGKVSMADDAKGAPNEQK